MPERLNKSKEKCLVAIVTTVQFLWGLGWLFVGLPSGLILLLLPKSAGVRKPGVPIEQWFPGREADSAEIIQAPPGTLQDVSLAPEQASSQILWYHTDAHCGMDSRLFLRLIRNLR